MKRFFKFLLIAVIATIGFTSCDEDIITNDATSALHNGNALYGFNSNGVRLLLQENSGVLIHKVKLDISAVSNVDRLVSYQVVTNTADANQLTFGEAVIPANSHEGFIELTIDANNFAMGDFKFISLKLDTPVTNSIFNEDKTLHNLSIGIPCLSEDMVGFYQGNSFWLGTSYHDVDVIGDYFVIDGFFEDIPAPLSLRFNSSTYSVVLEDAINTGFFHTTYNAYIWVRQSSTPGTYDPCAKQIKANLNYYIPNVGSFGDKVETFTIF